jgi:hypothetical protein
MTPAPARLPVDAWAIGITHVKSRPSAFPAVWVEDAHGDGRTVGLDRAGASEQDTGDGE